MEKRKSRLFQKLKERAHILKRDMTGLYYALKEKETPLPAKIIIVIALAYALSPIDLIPDFVPVLGQLDDLIIVPALIVLAVKLIPKAVMDKARQKAVENPVILPKNKIMAVIFVLIWTGLIVWAGTALFLK